MRAAPLPETRSPPADQQLPEASSEVWARASGQAAWRACDLVRVFDEDPDLLGDIEPASADLLRRRAVAPKIWAEPGPWTPPAPAHQRGWFGLLVIEGLLIRSVHLEGRDCPEVIGVGDLLRPWEHDHDASVSTAVSWSAVEPSALAILDERFAAAVCRWPAIVSGLLARSAQYSRTLAFQRAIAHVRHAEMRLQMLLWHLADRWGRVTLDGIHLPLALTHETLAHLSCMRRPTASTALQVLARTGEIERRPDGTWLLRGDPPPTGP